MPANLTPEFLKARERFNASQTPEEKLAALEEMLTTIPKHKGTEKMQADIKRRIAKLRDAQAVVVRKRSRSSSYDHIDRAGAGQVVLVGPPNSGKSSLLAALTNARPEIGDYPFSTIFPVPGMMRFEDISIQLIDLPPITTEFTEPWVYNLIRDCDLCLLVLDGSLPEEVLHESLKEILSILEEQHIRLAESKQECEDLRTKVIPCRLVLTKKDRAATIHGQRILDYPVTSVSTTTGAGLDDLRRLVFAVLRIIRIYTKLPGRPPDLNEPYTLPSGSTILDAVRIVHREFVEKLKYVRIWGSGKFDGQQVPTDHPLQDKDIIEIHLG
jgi:hypothetical protein